jgi:hypothetical protein
MSVRRARSAALTAAMLLLTACAAGSAGSEGSVVGAWGEEPCPNITIAENGEVTGSDGCNRLTGTGTISGDRIEFGTLAQTRMACAAGTDVVEPWATSATVDGDELVLLDEAGEEIRRPPRDA